MSAVALSASPVNMKFGQFQSDPLEEWGHRVGPVQAVRVGPVLVDIARHFREWVRVAIIAVVVWVSLNVSDRWRDRTRKSQRLQP